MKIFFNNVKIQKDKDGNFFINKAGITLIALIITVVVLIVLASVIIGIAIGQNGLVNRTKQAKEDYLVKANEEQLELANAGTLQSTRDTTQSAVPAGTVISYIVGSTAPTGYLACDGTVYNIADYQVLADAIKAGFGKYNQWGGDGTTTFAVPNLQGEFLRGTGTNIHTNSAGGMLEGSGADVGKHQDATLERGIVVNAAGAGYVRASTIHINRGGADHTSESPDAEANAGNWENSLGNNWVESGNKAKDYTSRPTNTSVLYCIKY